MPLCFVLWFCHCHTESYYKREKQTLFDLGQEHLHIFPGSFLGRLPSETVILPAISATAWSWKISFPWYTWKWGTAHRDALGSTQERRGSEWSCRDSPGLSSTVAPVTLKEHCCRMEPILLWRTQVLSPAAVQRHHLPGMLMANKYQFGTTVLELTDHYLRIRGWRRSTLSLQREISLVEKILWVMVRLEVDEDENHLEYFCFEVYF